MDDDIPVDVYDGDDGDDTAVMLEPEMRKALTVEQLLDLRARATEEQSDE